MNEVMLMLGRRFFIVLIAAIIAGGARAGAPNCIDGSCNGLFDVGPYKFQFFATQKNDGERFYREAPNFGLTRLNVEFVGRGETPEAENSTDLEIDVALYWGKNELKPPELLETQTSRGLAPIGFDYDFAEDGKYIVTVAVRMADGATYRGQHIFFVIATAESDYLLVGAAALFILGFALMVWRRRQKPLTRSTPRQ